METEKYTFFISHSSIDVHWFFLFLVLIRCQCPGWHHFSPECTVKVCHFNEMLTHFILLKISLKLSFTLKTCQLYRSSHVITNQTNKYFWPAFSKQDVLSSSDKYKTVTLLHGTTACFFTRVSSPRLLVHAQTSSPLTVEQRDHVWRVFLFL